MSKAYKNNPDLRAYGIEDIGYDVRQIRVQLTKEDFPIRNKQGIHPKCSLCKNGAKRDRGVCQVCLDIMYHNKKEGKS